MKEFYVKLNYQTRENNVSIFRDDNFFFPQYNAEEEKATTNYISKKIKKDGFEGGIWIQEIQDNGTTDKNGVPKSDYVNFKYIRIESGACTVCTWLEKYDEYSSGTIMSIQKGIEALKQLLEVDW